MPKTSSLTLLPQIKNIKCSQYLQMLAGWVTIVIKHRTSWSTKWHFFFSFPNISFSLEFFSHCSVVCFLYWKLQTSKPAGAGNRVWDQVYVLSAEAALLSHPPAAPSRCASGESGMLRGSWRVHDTGVHHVPCVPSQLSPHGSFSPRKRLCVLGLPSNVAAHLKESPLTPPPSRVAGSKCLWSSAFCHQVLLEVLK